MLFDLTVLSSQRQQQQHWVSQAKEISKKKKKKKKKASTTHTSFSNDPTHPILKRTPNPPQRNLPTSQPPRPNPKRDAHIEEIENERPAKNDGVERPGSFFRQLDFGDDDCPWEDPKEVRSEGLIEVPAGAGGEEDGG